MTSISKCISIKIKSTILPLTTLSFLNYKLVQNNSMKFRKKFILIQYFSEYFRKIQK